MKKQTPVIHHPLYQRDNALDLGIEEELTPDQRASAFLSRFQHDIDPLENYSEYFESSAKSDSYIFLEIKRYYKKLVIEKGWSERKYAMVLDDIFSNRAVFSLFSLDRAGLAYESGSLASQRSRRRRR